MLRVVVVRALLILAIGCNQIYGLDETDLAPPPPDLDGDSIPDELDNCPVGANPDQRNSDDDDSGDVCDLCPMIATAGNHDEDSDTVGDQCDLCPTKPNFALDADTDGVGDDCDNDFATRNMLMLFDAFASIDPAWQARTAAWMTSNDVTVATQVDTQ